MSAGKVDVAVRGRADPYPEFQWCRICGWMKGGADSWNGRACKCGYSHHATVKCDKTHGPNSSAARIGGAP